MSSVALNGIGRSLQRIGPVGGAGVVMSIAGAAIIAIGVTTVGLWLCAIGVVVVVASRAGLMFTQYQRSVAIAMRPLSRIALTTRTSADEHDKTVRSVEALPVPDRFAGLHANVVHAMRQCSEQSVTNDAAAVENAIAARQIFEQVLRLADDSLSLDDRSYITQLCGMVNDFVGWHDARFMLYRDGAYDALAQLQVIKPPHRKQAVHRDLVEAIVNRDELAQSRREFIAAGDIDGALDANGRVIRADERIRICLRAIT